MTRLKLRFFRPLKNRFLFLDGFLFFLFLQEITIKAEEDAIFPLPNLFSMQLGTTTTTESYAHMTICYVNFFCKGFCDANIFFVTEFTHVTFAIH